MTTKSNNSSVKQDLRDQQVRWTLFCEAMRLVFAGDVDAGKSALRDYINGTIGFVKLGAALGKSPKSLMRMLSKTGNPSIRSFSEMVVYLQKIDNMVLVMKLESMVVKEIRH